MLTPGDVPRPKIQAAATYAVTIRCVCRKLFLTPFAPQLHGWVLYFLSEAAAKTGAIVHQITIEPNHIHFVVTSVKANMPIFKRLFHGEVSKLVKWALEQHGYEAPERTFGDARSHQMRLVNIAAQLVWLHYSDIQTVKDGLVEKVEDYPGFTSDPGMMAGASMILDRPPMKLDPRVWPAKSTLRFGMVPSLDRALGAQHTIYSLRKMREDAERAYAAKRKRPVLGARRLLRQHPWAEPAAPRKKRKPGPVPTFMVVDDDELQSLCEKETRYFGDAHEEARQKRLAGEEATFPAGTYVMQFQHGAPVEDPADDAVLAVWETFEDMPNRMTAEQRHAVTSVARRLAREVDEDALADNLAARLEATRDSTVDRFESPNVSTEAGEPAKKLVTLRSQGRSDPSVLQDERSSDEPPDPASDK